MPATIDQYVDVGKGIDYAGDAPVLRSLVGDIHRDADRLSSAGANLRARGLRRIPLVNARLVRA